jgi:hypothetical protein
MNPYPPGTERHAALERANLPRQFVIDEARQINEHIAAGRTVHYQRKSTEPWRRIVAAEPVGSMMKFDFADGSFRLCRCWLGAAQNADESYSLAWNLKTGEA